jgi:uncharacterized membrane protein YedE/YeeE
VHEISFAAVVPALCGGALLGLAASIALVGHGRITGVAGIIGRALDGDGGRTFRLAFLAGMIAVGALAAVIAPSCIGRSTRGIGGLVISGLLVGVGTTYGNGCTTGHGICGLSRGSFRSLVGVMVFMTCAAITVGIVGGQS